MNTPIRTTNLPAAYGIDEVIGNVTIDGVQRTRRISVESLAQQLGGTPGTIGPGAVTNEKLAAGAVTDDKVAHTLVGMGANPTGVFDASAILKAAVASMTSIKATPGTYLIDTDTTVPAGVTVEFDEGAVFEIGTGVTLTWNGGIKAGPYQRIFAGHLVQSSYASNSLTPYTLALQGSRPRIDWCSPWWFGAVGNGRVVTDGEMTAASASLTSASAAFTAADVGKYIVVKGAGAAGVPLISTISAFVSSTQVTLAGAASTTVSGVRVAYGTDDYDAFVCALFFGRRCYIPGIDVDAGDRYLCRTSLPVRQSNSEIFGDGYSSWMVLASFVASGVGQFFGVAGLLPTVSGGQPAAFVSNVLFRAIHIDTNNGVNDNGIGGSMCRGVKTLDCHFSNVGRKAVTWQYHVHDNIVERNIVHSASMEVGSTHSVFSTEGENSSFTYANGVSGFDHDGADNTGHVFRDCVVHQSGYSGITVSNARSHLIDGMKITSLGALGRPVIISRVSIDNTFRAVKVKQSTRGFLVITSATTISQRFEDCWIDDCSGDYMLYSEGPGSTFIRCGGTQTDDRIAWTMKGADCSIDLCRLLLPAITSATQATTLFSTASRFAMRNCYVDSANALRGFGGGTTADIEVAGNTFTGGVTDGILTQGANAKVHHNTIGGNASGRVRVGTGATGISVHDNVLTGGASATIDWATVADLWASGMKCNNIGDYSTYHCIRLGVRIDGSYGGSPESVVTAAVGSTIRNIAGGKLYVKATGSGNTGWVVAGTQT